MQPYFVPYAGYFRLFAAGDLFVVYDCVQFPRRGWVHRNRLPDANGVLHWLTLPIEASPRSTLIRDLTFAPEGEARFRADLRRFPSLAKLERLQALDAALKDFSISPIDYLVRALEICCRMLGLPFNVVRSSSLAIPAMVRGADRIISIANALGASRYVNAPGGRALYAPEAFQGRGIELNFLAVHRGPASSILHRLLTEPVESIREEILSGSTLAS